MIYLHKGAKVGTVTYLHLMHVTGALMCPVTYFKKYCGIKQTTKKHHIHFFKNKIGG